MVDLVNLLEHKRGTRVLVNGTVYDIGEDGIARGVANSDADKMLQNSKVWKIFDANKVKILRQEVKKASRGKMQLVSSAGPVPRLDESGSPMDPDFASYERPDPAPKQQAKPAEPQAVPESPKAEATEEEEVDGEQAETAGEVDDWPDPDEAMELDYLREMAEAYEVKFTARTGKKTLCRRIHAAMYE
jgi:uncharacterized membrane protein